MRQIFKSARKIHKWLGYILALQIFAWLLGGFVMSAIPLEKVHGKHLAKKELDNPFQREDYKANIDVLMSQYTQISRIEFSHFLDIPLLIIHADKPYFWHGMQGTPFAPPLQEKITQKAKMHYLGKGKHLRTTFLLKGPREIGYKEQVWQVVFDDFANTHIYLSAKSGQMITIRSTIWRIFDFFWMLHIMDYDEREDFNNPLLITFSIISVLFCISGVILLLQNPFWKRKRLFK